MGAFGGYAGGDFLLAIARRPTPTYGGAPPGPFGGLSTPRMPAQARPGAREVAVHRPQRRAFPVAILGATVFAIALAVAACGGGSTGIGSTGAPTAAPTGAATAAATAQPSPTPIVLAKTFTAANGRTVGHPDGWVVREDMVIIYASTTEVAATRLVTLGSLEADEVFVQFAENSILSGATADPFVHLPDNLRLLLESSGFTAGAPTGLPWAARPAARLDAANDRLQMLAVSIRVRDDLFADVIAYAAPGEMSAHEALILAMIESLTYPPS